MHLCCNYYPLKSLGIVREGKVVTKEGELQLDFASEVPEAQWARTKCGGLWL
jgi:hypothetical protein